MVHRSLAKLSLLISVFTLPLSAAFAQPTSVNDESATATKVVAAYSGKQVTYKDFLTWFDRYQSLRRSPFSVDDLKDNDQAMGKRMLEEMTLTELYSKKARAAGLENRADAKTQIEQVRASELRRGLGNKIIFDAVRPITEQEAREYYDKNKVEYVIPFSFKMRYIFLSSYAHYETKDGDTLEEIAKTITGDSSAVERILTDTDEKSPRWVSPDERKTKEFVPLNPGEKLLVPMGEKGSEEVRKRLEKIVADIKAGKISYEEAARDFSESDFKDKEMGPFPQGDKPMIPELLEAAKKMNVDEISGVIKSKHGYQVLKVSWKREERQRTFDEVKSKIINDRLLKDRSAREKEYTMGLYNLPEIKIDFAKLADAATPGDAVLMTYGQHQWRKKEMGDAALTHLKPDNAPADRQAALREVPGLWDALVQSAAEKEKIADTESFKDLFEFASGQVLARAYAITHIQDTLTTSETAYKEFYEKNKDSRYKKGMTYTVRQIVMKVLESESEPHKASEHDALTSKVIDTLREVRKTATTKEKFIEAVEKYSQDPGTAMEGGLLKEIPPEFRPGSFKEALETLKQPGDMSEPFVFGAFGYQLRLEEINPEMIRTYEEVREGLVEDYRRTRMSELAMEVREQVLKEANFEYKGLP